MGAEDAAGFRAGAAAGRDRGAEDAAGFCAGADRGVSSSGSWDHSISDASFKVPSGRTAQPRSSSGGGGGGAEAMLWGASLADRRDLEL
jgi:hypothetical protein